MNPSDLLRNAIPVVTLLAGLLLGWALSVSHNRRARVTPNPRDRMEMDVDDAEDAVHQAQVKLDQMDAHSKRLTAAIASMRQQIDDSELEHTHLLTALDERRASVKDARSKVATIDDSLKTRVQEADRLVAGIDKSIEELDLLNQMQDGYTVKINRLTQQVQWQDGELRMLRQTVKVRTAEIEEAQAQLNRMDGELNLLNRTRQQREIDIEHARQAAAQRDAEFRRQVGSPGIDPFPGGRPPARLAPRRIDVTPAERSEPRPLPAQVSVKPKAPTAELELEEDDLTVIPHLSDFYARQLHAAGIHTTRQLAALSEGEVRALLDIPGYHSPKIEDWLKAARKLTRKNKGE